MYESTVKCIIKGVKDENRTSKKSGKEYRFTSIDLFIEELGIATFVFVPDQVLQYALSNEGEKCTAKLDLALGQYNALGVKLVALSD